MAIILSVEGIFPRFGEANFIAPNATVVGRVVTGDNCSVWFNAVIRGDVNSIIIGNDTNIQDGAVIHATYQKAATIIGNRVSVGHNAIVHGCTLHNNILIGMGAIIMDNAVVDDYVIIGAGSTVLENTHCESGFIYAGSPARKVKPINDQQRALLDKLPGNYKMYADWFR